MIQGFLSPNISRNGRLVRALSALLLFVAAVFLFLHGFRWLAAGTVVAGGFVMFEALRGWCALRACGIKTRL